MLELIYSDTLFDSVILVSVVFIYACIEVGIHFGYTHHGGSGHDGGPVFVGERRNLAWEEEFCIIHGGVHAPCFDMIEVG